MANVQITAQNSTEDGWEFTVQTDAGTEHTVTVSRDYYQKLTNEEVSVQELVKDSFAFLSEREPAEAILSEFALPVIADYFPEYPDVVGR